MIYMLRVTDTAFQTLQRCSGSNGVYIEARSHDGKQHDMSQHTVWLQKMSSEEAQAAQNKIEGDSCLVRVSYRYGLRVPMQAAKEVHEKFRPAEPFLASSVKSTWIVGPMPWGSTRKALIKLFNTWGWNAKPLQTAGVAADRTGLKWHAVADNAPPHYVYNLAHGDVLIVKATSPTPTTQASVQVEASAHTQRLMQPVRGKSTQLLEDPWADAANKLPHVQGANPPINIASLEASVEAKVLAKLQRNEDATMDVDVESRIAALESQVTMLQTEQHTQSKQTQTLQHQVESLGHQIASNGSQLKDHIDNQMKTQMERIEQLLAMNNEREEKRHKPE